VDVRDDTVWDGPTPFAALEPAPAHGDGAVSLRLLAPVVIGRATAGALVEALTGAGVATLDVGDELVRAEARALGWSGALRAPLAAPVGPGGPDGPGGVEDAVATVAALLPDVRVERRASWRRAFSLRATTSDGVRLSVKIADRPDVVPELVAAALDTAFGVRRRFGRMASGVHTIAIDDGAGKFNDHSTLGSAQSGTGTFFLDTSLACADAMDEHRRRANGRRGVSAVVPRPWFMLDGVVAHEYWHNLDSAMVAAPATYLEFNRVLGAELGVETFEHALRGGERNAPPEWQAAFSRIVAEVSPYATTNMREATAELFKLWWCQSPARPPAPLVARFGALVERYYPAVTDR
jgi:hypothetical protein